MDELEALGEIYDAIGDAERWRVIERRIVAIATESPGIERHLAIARRAHEQHLGISQQVSVLSAALNQTTLGAIVVDSQACIVRRNAAAEALLSRCQGLAVVDGRLRAANQSDDSALRDAVSSAASSGANDRSALPFILVARRGAQPLVVVVRHAEAMPSFLDVKALVMLLILDLGSPGVPPCDVLRGVYGLTEREAEFAALLMRGLDVKEAARELAVAVTTARTFLSHIREKTASCTQAELMQRLLAIPQVRR